MTTATPTIADYLRYADLQIAAEAFLRNEQTGATAYLGRDLIEALVQGNGHATVFTRHQAVEFEEHWEVVEQIPNTLTGFSGTLFKCIQDDPATGAKAGELVMSFRSTEFIDDAARDNQATNALENTLLQMLPAGRRTSDRAVKAFGVGNACRSRSSTRICAFSGRRSQWTQAQ